ncbi:type IV pilus biogenesis protein PilP [Candidatus Symbiopectobacterium sp.]|uniref:type IV pilus biogenesis protein PilP n=1 Tax=Candidatus Symbiopectobacterium sp. TaxID=2816440 RepID=UPI0025BC768D|nr:type IV pilus biogenesis protein PilP [Candidatus Symbiopectobacterium sp.]
MAKQHDSLLFNKANLLLEQQVQTARLQQQLRQSLSDDSGTSGIATPVFRTPNSVGAIPPPSVPGSAASTLGRAERVRLQEIYGRAGELRARITLPSGGVTEVHKGDVIPGTKLTVTTITADVVRLSDGSELTF